MESTGTRRKQEMGEKYTGVGATKVGERVITRESQAMESIEGVEGRKEEQPTEEAWKVVGLA